jgi:hypothetical protein
MPSTRKARSNSQITPIPAIIPIDIPLISIIICFTPVRFTFSCLIAGGSALLFECRAAAAQAAMSPCR